MKRAFLVVVGVAAIVWSSVLVAQGPAHVDLLIGMWKQNMEKSTYDPGPPPAKGSGSVRQYAAGDDGAIVAITMTISPEGLPSLGAISAANYDGKEYAQHTLATLASSLGARPSSRGTADWHVEAKYGEIHLRPRTASGERFRCRAAIRRRR